MQDDDTGTAAQRVDDPAVRFRIVADVVEGDVGGHRPRPAAADNFDFDELLERGQKERAVVGDARPFGRQRRVVRDLHASRRWIVSSHETVRAISLPARPHCFASSM